jgi:flagellum-specific peptidoglycan hydrolase FlgJ
MKGLFKEGLTNFKKWAKWLICNGIVLLVFIVFTCFVVLLSGLMFTIYEFKQDNNLLHIEVKQLRSDLGRNEVVVSSSQDAIASKISRKHKYPKTVCGEPIKDVLSYVNKFKKVALVEQEKYGIPASITLAQGILESRVGKSRLTTIGNNHFGIKCQSISCKKGHCLNYSDDHHKDFFVKYESAWESYRAHSKFLKGKRYKKLFKLEVSDYEGWARGLKECGYATDKRYADKLIKIIKDLKLWSL